MIECPCPECRDDGPHDVIDTYIDGDGEEVFVIECAIEGIQFEFIPEVMS